MKLDILAFGAHPDDVEISASGTLLIHIEKGYTCGIVDLTRGERSIGPFDDRERVAYEPGQVERGQHRPLDLEAQCRTRPDQRGVQFGAREVAVGELVGEIRRDADRPQRSRRGRRRHSPSRPAGAGSFRHVRRSRSAGAQTRRRAALRP